jgi:hypothetical protein
LLTKRYRGDQIKKTGIARHVALKKNKRRADRVSMGTRGVKRPLAIPRRRWENNIKVYLQEIDGGRVLN